MPAWVDAISEVVAGVGRELAQLAPDNQRARESWKTVLSVLLAVTMSFVRFGLDDAYWAAFTAFMVLRAGTGETILRGFLRIFGTAAGALTGWGLAGLAANRAEGLLLAMMSIAFVSTFQFAVSRYSYAWMFFGLTAELVLTLTLAAPEGIFLFVTVRVAEVAIGVTACVIASLVFELIWPVPDTAPTAAPATAPKVLPLWRGIFHEDWVSEHRLPLTHAARGAVAFAVLFMFWRFTEFTRFVDSAVTSYMVLLVPGAAVRQGKDSAMTNRGAQRLVGCVLGGCFALLALAVVKDSFPLWIVALAAGVWIAAWVQNGTQGVSYAGSQFALALLVTLVQSNGPPETLQPAWLRFQGVLVGAFALCLVQAVWPLPAPESPKPNPT
jgi:uncharacterized membrane protein YccC